MKFMRDRQPRPRLVVRTVLCEGSRELPRTDLGRVNAHRYGTCPVCDNDLPTIHGYMASHRRSEK